MRKSDYSVFFSHELTGTFSELFFGVSHFFNRVKAWTGWHQSYNEVLQNRVGGRVLLGQIPIDSFNAELLGELSPNGLIVSCNDCFELAGCGATTSVSNPSLWAHTDIEHHHLPFTDFTDNANPELLLETLEKMWAAYNRGEAIYIHCKAGRSRSALVVALFMCLIELKASYHQIGYEEGDLELLLKAKIEQLKEKRSQVSIGQAKINLGVRVLLSYIGDEFQESQKQTEVFTQSGKFFAKLTQSSEFKALWHYVYNHPTDFEDMQVLMNALYEDPLTVLKTLTLRAPKTDTALVRACQNLRESPEGRALLYRLRQFLYNNQEDNYEPDLTLLKLAYQQFNEALESYKQDPDILKIARQLQSAVFLSTAPDEDKVDWLAKTANFLADPLNLASNYYKEAENAVVSDNPSTRRIAKTMIIIGAVVLMFALFAGILSTSTFTVPVVSMIAFAAIAFMALGKMIGLTAVDDNVKLYSQSLVREFEKLEEVDSFNGPS
ncbi:Dual specificity phosphatase, catalytic domain [Legionella massiliensis]|uniref:Dual specificity phosphatase, catalytic domain n=1 Tax=Legionella massiliensis TaxID=1034943 RepID=A0A078KW18_9GAMM|nr:dual specificity protein phosphatase family protein [Legionella massiliensis]CDZ75893.1 Dual specificity phosphatase, catalytic domain [Legionella massiliensis]CEE11631.1 Dual specificity phosphatase, catalytic domain [Legionella massiliensis]